VRLHTAAEVPLVDSAAVEDLLEDLEAAGVREVTAELQDE